MPPGAGIRGVAAFLANLSSGGVVLGTLFFAASLTPSLAPRDHLVQGILAGICFAVGYGVGVLWRTVWDYMELPRIAPRLRYALNLILIGASVLVAIAFLWQAAGWQNSIRVLMKMEPVDSAHPLKVCLLAILTFIVLLLLAKLFRRIARFLSGRIHRHLSRRVANVLGTGLAILLFWSIASDVLFRAALVVLDSSYQQRDALLEPDRSQPTDPSRSGSVESLIGWRDLGRAGREFIASGPTAADISALSARPARTPIRVYVGMRAAESPEARARLALEELIRVQAFERKALIVITPTGTGWIDPAAMDAAEYLYHGDTASVAVQYSYLSSPLSLVVHPDYGAQAARELFRAVYDHWTGLPRDRRPRLYLHGLSLGAMNSERSAQLFEMIADPIHGAVWSGPPFASSVWRSVTNARNPDSPAWLPRFRDGSLVRFMNQDGTTLPADAPWGPIRVVYLQYASDAVTFFDPRDLYRPPQWLAAPRGPDVSPELRWFPGVTMLQLALDMTLSMDAPIGFGHVYAPEHYVDAWLQVLDVQDWSAEGIAALKQRLAKLIVAPADGPEDAYHNRGG